ncbi:hypothetical protein [Nocardioides sp.]|uniref:hypothetical protein n=1 Tax=Nocardioides sp. TaxID=35761 RepID=UPI003569F34E
MMSFAPQGFVFLSTTKSGSTAIQREFRRYASIEVRRPPKMKHMTVRAFNAAWVPALEFHGYPRESYELVAIVREPVDWTLSWWRYRSRRELLGHPNYTGDLRFEEFAERILARELRLGNPGRFVTEVDGTVAVDRVYKYESLTQAVAWMASKLDVAPPTLPHTNRSPQRDAVIPSSLRSRLEEFFALEKRVHEDGL